MFPLQFNSMMIVMILSPISSPSVIQNFSAKIFRYLQIFPYLQFSSNVSNFLPRDGNVFHYHIGYIFLFLSLGVASSLKLLFCYPLGGDDVVLDANNILLAFLCSLMAAMILRYWDFCLARAFLVYSSNISWPSSESDKKYIIRIPNNTMNITMDPISMTDASVLDDKHRNAVDAINSNNTTTIPTMVTSHIVPTSILSEYSQNFLIFLGEYSVFYEKFPIFF